MTRKCQHCAEQFLIEPDDLNFYKKIEVPPPTFCPNCRFQRRLAFFNLIHLYRRHCDLCKKDTISMYAPETPYVVYCPDCWWSDNWDAFSYGHEYDFSRPFFEQLQELWHKVPLLGLSLDLMTTKNSPHNNHAGRLKNCYLLFASDEDEDCAYGFSVVHSRSTIDCSLIMQSELCYDSVNAFKNNRCIGTRHQVTESLDCKFIRDCKGCRNCFASANLRNKEYYIFNKPYTKEDYFKEISRWDLGSYKMYQEVKKLAEDHWQTFPPRPDYQEFTANCTGSYVFQSKNCKECYEVVGAEDCKYMQMMYDAPIKDCYDVTNWGNNLQFSYEGCVIGTDASHMRFCQEAGLGVHYAEYSKLTIGGAYQFGCIALKKGEYCILNKRYTPEAYAVLRHKIIEHMHTMPYVDKKGRTYTYGEFFPIEFSPFAYNETLAQKFFPLTVSEVRTQGWKWREPEKIKYKITKKAEKLSDHIKNVSDEITQEVIGCMSCERGFRIISIELEFLRRMNLPLPRECPFCRLDKHLDYWVNNFWLVEQTCDECGKTFKTPHKEKGAYSMLCKQCYVKVMV